MNTPPQPTQPSAPNHRRDFLKQSLVNGTSLLAAAQGSLLLRAGWCHAADGGQATVEAEAATSPLPDADAWPMFRGAPECRGVAPGPLAAALEMKWKYTADEGSFEGTAAIAGPHAFLGDMNGSVYAITLADGQVAWTQKINEFGFSSSPCWRDGRLYVGDFDGVFYCLDAKDGKELWRYTADAEINSCANFHANAVLFGSQDANLYCLDAQSGELKWKHTIEDQIQCTPAVVEDRAFVAGCDAKLHVIDLTEGKAVGQIEIDGPTGVTPAVNGAMVYIGTESGTFYGIDWRAQKVVWSQRPDRGDSSYRSSAAAHDQHVVVGGRNKKVTSFDPQTGKVQWEFTARRRIDSSPVVVGKRVFVGVTDGRFYGLSLESGAVEFEYEAGGSLSASPAVAQSRIVIANDRGSVFCFG